LAGVNVFVEYDYYYSHRCDRKYLSCIEKMMDSQLNVPHGIRKRKNNDKELKKLISTEDLVPVLDHGSSPVGGRETLKEWICLTVRFLAGNAQCQFG